MPKQKEGKPNRYDAIILHLFEDNYREGITEFEITIAILNEKLG